MAKEAPSLTFMDQLMMARDLTIRLGSIHESQKLQLAMWARLFPDTKTGIATLDAERKMVTYRLKATKKFQESPLFQRYCKEVTTWTRTILWAETIVTVRVGDKDVYDTRSEQPT